MDRVEDRRRSRRPGDRQRRIGAHAARIRAAVAVEEPLVVAGGRQGDRPRSRRRWRSRSPPARAGAPRRRHARAPSRAKASMAASRLVGRLGDRHALAGGQSVGLDHDAVAVAPPARARSRPRRSCSVNDAARGHRDPRSRGDVVAERLRRLDPGGRRGRPERRDTRAPRARRPRRPRAAPPAR